MLIFSHKSLNALQLGLVIDQDSISSNMILKTHSHCLVATDVLDPSDNVGVL